MQPLPCFVHAEPIKAGFVGRLFGRKPKENCFIEIQNLLATRPLSDLAAADVENILSEYELPRPEASPQLMQFYRTAVAHLAADHELSPADRDQLDHLRYVLGLEEVEYREAEIDVLRERYREFLKHALQDSHLTDSEKPVLETTAKSFGLNEAIQQAVYKEEVLRVVQEVFDSAIQDQRLTAEEDDRLAQIANNLGVDVTHDDATQRLVERFRLLARIERGDIPEIIVPVLLQRGEKAYAQFNCRLHEKRTITRAVSYHGPSGSVRIMKGLSWRYGYRNVNRITSEELRQIDSGTLYITSKRLLFNGQSKNCNTPYTKILSFTMYKDGLQIEKETGRDQYFLGDGDIELLGTVMESAIRVARG